MRERVKAALQDVVGEVLDASGRCAVLEVGAGHGPFTDHLVALGARVEVTEMSRASADVLASRYRHNPAVTVVHDESGRAGLAGPPVDVVVCVSVLHHIPDYLGAVRGFLARVRPGGAFVSFQDPLFYPRQSRAARLADRGSYLAWRVGQGELARGLRTVGRRLAGRYEDDNPSDTVEYHVVRQGVDEHALLSVARARFARAEVLPYWSTQSSVLQVLGGKSFPPNTFGLVARDRAQV
ncbi:methyltransferase domain-containing protein [Actinosynnema sp. NPDC020468]|uniref:class I SAM-dependent methyltransferase n=1 Tax=Actinosynnema sp. NPDC020468 TaxID=3154488 RepID=UPI0033FF54F6